MTAQQEQVISHERRAGRRPSKDIDIPAEVFAQDVSKEILQSQAEKIAQAMKNAANHNKKKQSRRTPARTFSSDSHDDYHKLVYASH